MRSMGGGNGNFPTELGDEEEDEAPALAAEEEEWCFVCKDGGNLLLCDHENCPKAYHRRCAKLKKSFLNSKEHWECAWHTCRYLNCGTPSDFCCYLCPVSVCRNCMDPKYFFPIKGKYGFCIECTERVLDIENEIVDVEDDLPTEYFKEYYEFVKKQEGFNLSNIRSPKELEMKRPHKVTSNSGDAVVHNLKNDHDKSVVTKSNGKLVEDNKKCEGLQKRKFNHVTFDEDLVTCRGPKKRFASIIPENLRLVYLQKSVVVELQKKPETFENKVIGSFVRVKSPIDGDRRCNSYQLVQVTGITNDSSGSSPVFKLQLRDIPNDVCIDLLSDALFSEEECKALRQKVEDGLLDKPTVEVFEHKAKDLHHDLTKHRIARDLKTLQNKIDIANEKGRRNEFVECMERKGRLESESEVKRMLNTPPKVIAEILNVELPVANDTMDDKKKRKRSERKKRHISMDVEGTKGTSVSDCVVEVEVIQEPFSHRIVLQEKNIAQDSTRSPKNSVIEKSSGDVALDGILDGLVKPTTCPKNSVIEKSSSDVALDGILDGLVKPTTSPENSVIEKSSGDVALDGILDGLVKPDLPKCCLGSVPAEAIHHINKGCLLSLKEIPVANYKDTMISLANGFFSILRNLNVDYTQLYGRVKDYIWHAAQLAYIDNSKIGCPTVEELAATYKEKKLCYEKNSEAFNVMSRCNGAVVSEVSGERSVYVSRISSMIKMSEELEKSKKEMVLALYALDNGRKKWLEEEQVQEDFMNAKASLV